MRTKVSARQRARDAGIIGSQSCGKVRYRTEVQAANALAVLRDQPGSQVKPVRAYACPDCEGFHLTSKGRPSARLGTCTPCQFDTHDYCEGRCSCGHGSHA